MGKITYMAKFRRDRWVVLRGRRIVKRCDTEAGAFTWATILNS